MGEGLDDLDTGDIFFDNGVDTGQGFLLFTEILLAGFGIDTGENQHDDDEDDDDEGEWDVDDEQRDDGSEDLDDGEEEVGEGIVKSHDDTIDIVGEVGHDFAMGVSIEVGDWKNLHLMHEFGSDSEEDTLGDSDHDLVVDEGA